MATGFTLAQKQRMTRLNAPKAVQEETYADAAERDRAFRSLEKQLVHENREKLQQLMEEEHRSLAQVLADDLSRWLTEEKGFTRVSTPIIISAGQMDKMTITGDHALRKQVFWVDRRHCLRPMLAMNLYPVMRDIHKITHSPVRIFEIGSCFRKESQGAKHMNEFTMLNAVEFAAGKDGYQSLRLEAMAKGLMKAAKIKDYRLIRESSEVYHETLDIEVDGVEVASGAYGPHSLDAPWGIFDTWVGIGIGIERLALVKGGYQTIKHGGKSLSYLNGVPLQL